MKIYVFGNEDLEIDNIAFKVIDEIGKKYKQIEFIKVKPNEDLPFANSHDLKPIIIMDTVLGLNEITLITDLNKFVLPPRSSVHDFDLSFQLKYLKKIGRLGEILIIGLPMNTKIDYLRIHSILRKLVAQDIQGS